MENPIPYIGGLLLLLLLGAWVGVFILLAPVNISILVARVVGLSLTGICLVQFFHIILTVFHK